MPATLNINWDLFLPPDTCYDVVIGELRLGRRTYRHAASYTQTIRTPEGSPAYFRGERTYTRTGILVIGRPPRKDYRQVLWNFEGDDRDWYITHTSPFTAETSMFGIAPWDLPERIDHWHESKRERIGADFTPRKD